MTAPDALDQVKATLRDRMRHSLAALDPDRRHSGSARIVQRLEGADAWPQARAILGFVPLPTEPDLLPALLRAVQAGRTVALPRWNPLTRIYEPAELTRTTPLVSGPFRVPEPDPAAPAIPLEQLDLILVPGLAFDRSGRRLGRGKGHFDRLLARAPTARWWGVCFDVQIVDEVPAADHDAIVHLLVTPDLWWPVSPAKSR